MPVQYEKRRTQRISIFFKVRVESIRGTFSGVGRDLSEGGMSIFTKKLPPVGSQVDLSFDLPKTDESIQVTGEVIHLSRPDKSSSEEWFGVKFVRMDAICHDRIRKFVRDTTESTDSAPTKPPPLPR